MASDHLKSMFTSLPLRDAVLLHNGLRNPEPLSIELREKLRLALRRTNVVTIRER